MTKINQSNIQQDLESLKQHEAKIKSYQKAYEKTKDTNKKKIPYRYLAYQVKNPFKGV